MTYGPTDGRTDGPRDGRTNPLIEMLDASKNSKWKLSQAYERKVRKMMNKNGTSFTTVASKFNVHPMTMLRTLKLTF